MEGHCVGFLNLNVLMNGLNFVVVVYSAFVASGILVSLTRIKPGPQRVKAPSPHHWIARKPPSIRLYSFQKKKLQSIIGQQQNKPRSS